MPQVRQAFEHAYYQLSSVFFLRGGGGGKRGVLERIITIKDEIVQHRRWVNKEWGESK